jgi:hypothetical protein
MRIAVTKRSHIVLRYIVFGFILGHLVDAYFSFNLLHQLVQPVVVSPGIDNTYWLLHLLAIPHWLTGVPEIALAFDALLVIVAFASLFIRVRALPMLFSVLYLLYFVTFNSYAGHHFHSTIGVLFITVPFWFKRGQGFIDAWDLLRYWLLFSFVAAVAYKLTRGTLFHDGQMAQIIQMHNIDLLVQQPGHWRVEVMKVVLAIPGMTKWLLWAGALIQATFLVGFFTRQFDLGLLIMAIVFHVSTWVLFGITFWEFWILYLTLIPWPRKAMQVEPDAS